MIEIFDNKIRNARVLLFTKKDGEFSFLLVKEHKGNWGHPGGCKEVEDKTIQETLERELREELGLEPNKYKLIGSIVTDTDYKYTNPASSRFGKTGSFEMFAAEFLGVKSDVVKSSDVEDARWLTQTEAEGLISDDDTRRRFKALVELIQKQS